MGQVEIKERSDVFGFSLIDDQAPDQFVRMRVVPQGCKPTHPEALLLGGGDLVSNALCSDLTFELRKREQDIQGQPAHRCRRIESLGHGDKRTTPLFEALYKAREVRK